MNDYKNLMDTKLDKDNKLSMRDLHKEIKRENHWLRRKILAIRDLFSIGPTKNVQTAQIPIDAKQRNVLEQRLTVLCQKIDTQRKLLETPTGKKAEISELKKLQKLTKSQRIIAARFLWNVSELAPARSQIESLDVEMSRSLKLRQIREKAADSLRRLDPVCVLAAKEAELSKIFRAHLINTGTNKTDFHITKNNIDAIYKDFVKTIVSERIRTINDKKEEKTLKEFAKDNDIRYFSIVKELSKKSIVSNDINFQSSAFINDMNDKIVSEREKINREATIIETDDLETDQRKTKQAPVSENIQVKSETVLDVKNPASETIPEINTSQEILDNFQHSPREDIVSLNQLKNVRSLLELVNKQTNSKDLKISYSKADNKLIIENKTPPNAQMISPDDETISPEACEMILSLLEKVAEKPGLLEGREIVSILRLLGDNTSINNVPAFRNRISLLKSVFLAEVQKVIGNDQLFSALVQPENGSLRHAVLFGYREFFNSAQLFTNIKQLFDQGKLPPPSDISYDLASHQLTEKKPLTVDEKKILLKFCYDWLKDDTINSGEYNKNTAANSSIKEILRTIPSDGVLGIYRVKIQELLDKPSLHLHSFEQPISIKENSNAEPSQLFNKIAKISSESKEYESIMSGFINDLNTISAEMLKKIPLSELSKQAWVKKDIETPNIDKVTVYFNTLVNYFASTMIDPSINAKKREKIINFYVDALSRLIGKNEKHENDSAIRNYFMGMAINSALSNSFFFRTVKITLPQELSDSLKSDNNFKIYNQEIKQAREDNITVIPFMPKMLTELTGMNEAKAETKDSNGIVLGWNLHKMEITSRLLSQLHEDISNLPESESPSLHYLTQNLPKITDQDLETMSHAIRPPDKPKKDMPTITLRTR
jgi:hypothetical protein